VYYLVKNFSEKQTLPSPILSGHHFLAMSINCYPYLAELLSHDLNEDGAVLATIAGIKGSAPREVGAKMVIWGNGEIFSTIGGGAGEAKVIQVAQQVLISGQKQWVEIDLSGVTSKKVEGVCGGQMRVWLERWSGKSAIALLQSLLETLKKGQAINLVTPFENDQSPYLLAIDEPIPSTEVALVETVTPPPLLLIVGAGHVGEQLAKIASSIGFEIAVQDDRSEWANSTRYAIASQIFTDPIETVLDHLKGHADLYVALVTRGYQYDLEALEILLKNYLQNQISCRYIGMIGSKKRVRLVLQTLEKKGVSTLQFPNLYAPIGLDIGALTPEEIAVSIAAELILVRRGGTGKSLSSATSDFQQ
jgi:xanthine dehydrogenase accessory factor